jgi:hypothetical protein
MKCPHCTSTLSPFLPFSQPIEGGRAFAQTCSSCGRIHGIRPWIEGDPPVFPDLLSRKELARLEFVRWRLRAECSAQVPSAAQRSRAAPLNAA